MSATSPPRSNLAPLLVGLAVAAIGMSFGANAGYAINPARDFGPRVFAWLAGYVEGFGETVEEQPTTADGQVEVRGRTVRER
jgi:glycerol uptake facilitator-like aquaporin